MAERAELPCAPLLPGYCPGTPEHDWFHAGHSCPAVSLPTSCQSISTGHAAADVGLTFFHLAEFKLHRRGSSENQHSYPQAAFLVIDFLDSAGEIIEGPIDNADHFARFVDNLVSRLVLSVFETLQDFVRFLCGNRSRLLSLAANEAHDSGSFFHQVPGIVVELHLYQYIARKKLTLAFPFLPGTHFQHL